MEILFDNFFRTGVMAVTFSRPDKGNAFTGNMAKVLCDKLKLISEDRSIRALLLAGQGEHFMDGHDIHTYVGDTNIIQEQIFVKVQFFYTAIRELQNMERPVICAAKGRVTGAGFSMMLASDLVIAAEDTVFNTGYTRYAMVPDGGATFFLARKIGAAKAMELMLLSENFSARQALEWGLINRVVPAASLQAESVAWAEKLAKGPTRTYGAVKRLIGKSFENDLHAFLSIETAQWTATSKTFDFREAMKAFVANRPPKFTGS
jgi:2-(1,2-epoxy-1,2-dihydrophenyl)acetyl-CoA isomerase